MSKSTMIFLAALILQGLTSARAGGGDGPSFDDASAAAGALLYAHAAARIPASSDASALGEPASSGFDETALYVAGAKVANIYADRDSGYRTLSVKIYTTRESGDLINRIGVVDITEGDIATPTRPQFIGVRSVRTNYFQMTAGGRKYALKLSSNGDILLTRIDTREGEGGALSTSLQELIAERNRQIAGQATVTIEGIAYYVLAQGGDVGSFLFFRKDGVDQNPDGDMHPDLMGDVTQALSDGSSAPISGHPRLGSLRNGDPFHLELGDDGLWRIVPGEGDTGN